MRKSIQLVSFVFLLGHAIALPMAILSVNDAEIKKEALKRAQERAHQEQARREAETHRKTQEQARKRAKERAVTPVVSAPAVAPTQRSAPGQKVLPAGFNVLLMTAAQISQLDPKNLTSKQIRQLRQVVQQGTGGAPYSCQMYAKAAQQILQQVK